MKTTISLPTKTFARADRLAKRLKKTRSRLYQEAISEYIARHDPEQITESLNRFYGSIATPPDDWLIQVAHQTLCKIEW